MSGIPLPIPEISRPEPTKAPSANRRESDDDGYQKVSKKVSDDYERRQDSVKEKNEASGQSPAERSEPADRPDQGKKQTNTNETAGEDTSSSDIAAGQTAGDEDTQMAEDIVFTFAALQQAEVTPEDSAITPAVGFGAGKNGGWGKLAASELAGADAARRSAGLSSGSSSISAVPEGATAVNARFMTALDTEEVATDGKLRQSLFSEFLSEGDGKSDTRLLSTAGEAMASRLGAANQAAQNALAMTAARESAAHTALQSYTTSIELPVGHAQWGEQLAGKLSFLTTQGMKQAEIFLSPPDMGPMEVRVKVQQEQAHVTVHAAHPVVRDQLELNSHRLRDMLQQEGFTLAQFDVSDQRQSSGGEQSAGRQDGSGDPGAGASGNASGGELADGESSVSGSLDLSWQGEVDLYA